MNRTTRTIAQSIAVTTMATPCFITPGDIATATYPGPNGQIAYTSTDPATGEPANFISDASGTAVRPLPLPAPAFNPTWSPDGSRILVLAFTPDGPPRPATVNRDGSDFTILEVPELPDDAELRCTAWSPDAARLLCVGFFADTDRNGIYTIRASDGGDLTRLTVSPYPPAGNFGGGDIPGDYSPDGSRFVFMRAKPGKGPQPDRHQRGALFVANTDGSGLRQITRYGLANSHDNGLAHWSPDGREILFAAVNARFDSATLYRVRPDGSGLRPIRLQAAGRGKPLPFTPDWSPDGTRIVFSMIAPETGHVDIYTATLDGKDVVQVTDTPDFEDFADWGTIP
jgi:Tol biopolymer transport system component